MGSLRKYFSKLESFQFFFRNLFHVGPLVWNVFIHSKFKMKFCVKLENRKVFSFRFKGRNWFRKYPGNHPVCAQAGSKTRLLRNNGVPKFDFMIYINYREKMVLFKASGNIFPRSVKCSKSFISCKLSVFERKFTVIWSTIFSSIFNYKVSPLSDKVTKG